MSSLQNTRRWCKEEVGMKACASVCVHERLCVPLRMQALWKRRKVSKCRDCCAVVELFSISNESRRVSLSQHEWNRPTCPFIWRFSELEGTKKQKCIPTSESPCMHAFELLLCAYVCVHVRRYARLWTKRRKNHGKMVDKFPKESFVRVFACMRVCSCSVVTQCWVMAGLATQIETGFWGGQLQGHHGARTEHALKSTGKERVVVTGQNQEL